MEAYAIIAPYPIECLRPDQEKGTETVGESEGQRGGEVIHGCGVIHGGGVINSRGWLFSGSRCCPFAIRVAMLGVPTAVTDRLDHIRQLIGNYTYGAHHMFISTCLVICAYTAHVHCVCIVTRGSGDR